MNGEFHELYERVDQELRFKNRLKALADFVFECGGAVEIYVADLSLMDNVEELAKTVAEKHSKLDVLINNTVWHIFLAELYFYNSVKLNIYQ